MRAKWVNQIQELADRLEWQYAADQISINQVAKEAVAALRALPAQGEPVAWIVLSEETGNTRIWWRDKVRADAWCANHNLTPTPLYAAIPSSPAPDNDASDNDKTIEDGLQHHIAICNALNSPAPRGFRRGHQGAGGTTRATSGEQIQTAARVTSAVFVTLREHNVAISEPLSDEINEAIWQALLKP